MIQAIAAMLSLAFFSLAWGDPPATVGRLAYVSGDVQFYSDVDRLWVPATANMPVISRNSLYVGEGSRAQLRVAGTSVNLESNSQIDIEELNDLNFIATLVNGAASVVVAYAQSAETKWISAGPAKLMIFGPGRYHFEALADGQSAVATVFEGSVEARLENLPLVVEAGQSLHVDVESGQFVTSYGAAEMVAIDQWPTPYASEGTVEQATQYVSPYMAGYEDLDANGRWASDPVLGAVWFPTTSVGADWVPYRFGHWAFVTPWGWTWVDDAPWGFAPFHYGRWAMIGGAWGWVPGAYEAHPCYAPALVAFLDGTTFPGIGASNAAPAVGWYPLAPWERFMPGYHQGSNDLRRINNLRLVAPPVHDPLTVHNRSLNTNQFLGATVVSPDVFAAGLSIGRSVLHVAPEVLASLPVLNASLIKIHPQFTHGRDSAQSASIKPGLMSDAASGMDNHGQVIHDPLPLSRQSNRLSTYALPPARQVLNAASPSAAQTYRTNMARSVAREPVEAPTLSYRAPRPSPAAIARRSRDNEPASSEAHR